MEAPAILRNHVHGRLGCSERRVFPTRSPIKILAAKTVFLVNDSGTVKFGHALYRQLKDWNRWQIVTDREKADLVLVLTQQDTAAGSVLTASASSAGQSATATGVSVPITKQRWYLHLVDAKSGEKLWTSDASMGGKLWRSWSSIAKSLVDDIKKRAQ